MRCVHGNPQPQRGGMKAPQSIDEAMYLVACLALDIEASAHHAERRANALRREGSSEALAHAGWHVRYEAQAQTVLRELRKLQALGLHSYLGDVYANRAFEREDELAGFGVLPVVSLDERPQVVGEVDALHCDSPDVRSA